MSVLNHINQLIASSIKVEVKSPVYKSGKMKFPVLVTDVSNSFTNGWFVQYNPVSQENGTRLYDGSETFSELHIARFSELKSFIETANYYFTQGAQVESIGGDRKRAIYEPNGLIRLTVTSQKNSNAVTVTIVDEKSPFYMLSIQFTVTADKSGNNAFYVVGTDNERWDRNTDVFKEFSGNFAPRKARFYRVQQTQNGPATLRAKIPVINNQYAINNDGTFQVDTKLASPEYIQVITNEYKALAYIYEQSLMKNAFEKALAQGLPAVQNQTSSQPQAQQQQAQSGFNPAFGIPGAGTPNPNANPSPAPQTFEQQQAQQQQAQQQQAPQAPAAPQAPQQNNFSTPGPSETTNPAPGMQLPPGMSLDQLPWQQ
jgi:hypothetical protein